MALPHDSRRVPQSGHLYPLSIPLPEILWSVETDRLIHIYLYRMLMLMCVYGKIFVNSLNDNFVFMVKW